VTVEINRKVRKGDKGSREKDSRKIKNIRERNIEKNFIKIYMF